MNKKSIAQTMKDAGFKPLSKEQQRQNLEALTPVWIEEQNAMTTKTDRARECAEEALIKHMVDRFLHWRLPESFSPDNGISFKPTFNDHLPVPTKCNPTGTNLFDARETEAMVRYMLEGKHFPAEPMVAVERKLEHLLRNSETFGWRTANWVAAIRGLIAEAK